MKKILFIGILLFSTTIQAGAKTDTDRAQAATGKSKVPKKIQSEAGLNIPAWGVAVDAVYDNRLDGLVPGYKIVNVVLTNRSPNTINLDPGKDKWRVKDNIGKEHTAINHLKMESEALWNRLPQGLRDKLEYPSTVRSGYSSKIDLFFPASVDLANFKEIAWMSFHFKKQFDIHTNFDKSDSLANSEPIPNDSISYDEAIRKADEQRRLDHLATEQNAERKNNPQAPELIPKDTVTIPMD